MSDELGAMHVCDIEHRQRETQTKQSIDGVIEARKASGTNKLESEMKPLIGIGVARTSTSPRLFSPELRDRPPGA